MPPDLNTQDQFTSQPKVNFKKPPVYIVALIIFAALLGALQIADMYLGKGNQPQPEQNLIATDSTADWKTYRNEELGFSINTPSEWIVEYNETYNTVYVLTKTYDPNYIKMGVPLATIYTIYIRPIEEYKRVQEECKGELLDTPDCRGILDLLGTNSTSAFTYHNAINTDYPMDFDKELFELGIISSKTFKFTR